MKKTLISVIFLIFSLTVFGNYTVTQGANVKLSEKELKANNMEIENRVKTVFDINSYSTEEVKSIIWREYPLLRYPAETAHKNDLSLSHHRESGACRSAHCI